MIRQGDMIKITDSSYSMGIDGNLYHHIIGDDLNEEEFIVIATDLVLPVDKCLAFELPPPNNTIVRGAKSRRIVFTHTRFINVIYHTCLHCGMKLEY